MLNVTESLARSIDNIFINGTSRHEWIIANNASLEWATANGKNKYQNQLNILAKKESPTMCMQTRMEIEKNV